MNNQRQILAKYLKQLPKPERKNYWQEYVKIGRELKERGR